jgi:hypothetical protein
MIRALIPLTGIQRLVESPGLDFWLLLASSGYCFGFSNKLSILLHAFLQIRYNARISFKLLLNEDNIS